MFYPVSAPYLWDMSQDLEERGSWGSGERRQSCQWNRQKNKRIAARRTWLASFRRTRWNNFRSSMIRRMTGLPPFRSWRRFRSSWGAPVRGVVAPREEVSVATGTVGTITNVSHEYYASAIRQICMDDDAVYGSSGLRGGSRMSGPYGEAGEW